MSNVRTGELVYDADNIHHIREHKLMINKQPCRLNLRKNVLLSKLLTIGIVFLLSSWRCLPSTLSRIDWMTSFKTWTTKKLRLRPMVKKRNAECGKSVRGILRMVMQNHSAIYLSQIFCIPHSASWFVQIFCITIILAVDRRSTANRRDNY